MALTVVEHVDQQDGKAECIDNRFETVQSCEWCADGCSSRAEPEMG